MVRFIIDKFRHAPGPLKQPRLIMADLAEEIMDLISQYMGKSVDFEEIQKPAPPTDYPTTATAQSKAPEPSKTSPPKIESDTPPFKPTLKDIDANLLTAIKISKNRRKQNFKILAILIDAKNRDMAPLSAMEVSKHGKKLGLDIRHENVRKVIKLHLNKHVTVNPKGVANRTIYHYEINQAGISHFKTTYQVQKK